MKSPARSQATLYLFLGLLLLPAVFLSACDGKPRATASANLPTAGPAPIESLVATSTALAPEGVGQTTPTTTPGTPTPSMVPLSTSGPVETPTLTPTPSVTPDPYAGLAISELAARSYGGDELDILDTLEETETFTRYLITYPSDGLTIYGFLSVPREGGNFPVAIVAHGYIPPEEYDVEAYTTRYADALTEAGFFVIHPNFRNYPPSDNGPNPFRTGYAIDLLNLIAIIKEQSRDPHGYLRRADGENIYLVGHSMGGGAVLRAITVWPEAVSAAVLYGSMSGDEVKNHQQIQIWSNGSRGAFELAAPADTMAAISPINHLDRIQAAVSIHHSEDDETVPYAWSEELCALLQAQEHPVECFSYQNVPHTFRGYADSLFIDRMIAFFSRH